MITKPKIISFWVSTSGQVRISTITKNRENCHLVNSIVRNVLPKPCDPKITTTLKDSICLIFKNVKKLVNWPSIIATLLVHKHRKKNQNNFVIFTISLTWKVSILMITRVNQNWITIVNWSVREVITEQSIITEQTLTPKTLQPTVEIWDQLTPKKITKLVNQGKKVTVNQPHRIPLSDTRKMIYQVEIRLNFSPIKTVTIVTNHLTKHSSNLSIVIDYSISQIGIWMTVSITSFSRTVKQITKVTMSIVEVFSTINNIQPGNTRNLVTRDGHVITGRVVFVVIGDQVRV